MSVPHEKDGMNYRHAYHAGSHADVLKHAVLALIIDRLKQKPKPFRVIDAHAGTALYDLAGCEAGKTREWETGIGKLTVPLAPEVETLLKPYRDVLAASAPAYPGSPEIAARRMRAGDRLIANELHPEDHATLERHFRGDPRVTVTAFDAEACVKANLPPPERRGLVLLDPPYEQNDELSRAVRILSEGYRRFATGIYLLWYPLKADGGAERLTRAATALGYPGTLKVQMRIRESFQGGGLSGSGLILVNPPWRLDNDLRVLVPALATRLALGGWGQATVDWLLPPN